MNAGPEYAEVERPLVEQLIGLGWAHIEGNQHDPQASERSSFREVLLEDRLRNGLLRINLGPDGQPWLDDSRLSEAVSALQRPAQAGMLIEINEQMTRLMLEGVAVSGLPGWDQGRNQRVHFIDWEHPGRNNFLVINQFRVDEPGGQAKKWIAPDVVLLVNGIPLVVIECKSPYIIDPMAEGITQLRRYENQRDLGIPEGNEQLFWTNQFVVSTYGDKARVGTFTSGPEHFLEWRDAAPLTKDQLASQLGKKASGLSGQELLVAGMLAPANLLDLVRHFTLFTQAGGKTVKIVARYQQYRAVRKALDRLRHGKTRAEDGEVDRRGGLIWHTQGSGKSLTMVFLARAMRSDPRLRRFKIVVVTDRTDLEKQLLFSDPVAISGQVSLPAEWIPHGGDVSYQPVPLPRAQQFRRMQLDQQASADLVETWRQLRQPGLLQKQKALALALRRLSYQAYRQRIEDEIVDIMVAAEALYLSDLGPEELGFRLALRASALSDPQKLGMTRRNVFDLMKSAYSVRSKIVHGDEPKPKDLKVKGAQVPLAEFVQATEDVVRQGLREALNRAVGWPPDWDGMTLPK